MRPASSAIGRSASATTPSGSSRANPERLQEPPQGLERKTGLLGELEMGLRPPGTPRLERPTLDERERQDSRPDRLGHAFHRQATHLARPRNPDLQGIDRPEGPTPVTRDQDAEVDEAFDLRGGDPGPGRELRGRQLVRPARR